MKIVQGELEKKKAKEEAQKGIRISGRKNKKSPETGSTQRESGLTVKSDKEPEGWGWGEDDAKYTIKM